MNAAGGGKNGGHPVTDKRMLNASYKSIFDTTEATNTRKANGKGKMTKLSNGQTKLTTFFGTACYSEWIGRQQPIEMMRGNFDPMYL